MDEGLNGEPADPANLSPKRQAMRNEHSSCSLRGYGLAPPPLPDHYLCPCDVRCGDDLLARRTSWPAARLGTILRRSRTITLNMSLSGTCEPRKFPINLDAGQWKLSRFNTQPLTTSASP